MGLTSKLQVQNKRKVGKVVHFGNFFFHIFISFIFAVLYMASYLAIDYGKKRSGIAVSDPLKIIATGLCTVDTAALMDFLKRYIQQEAVELFVVGMPTQWDDSDTHATPLVRAFILDLQRNFPDIPVKTVDEWGTSRDALRTLVQSGVPKMKRRNKALLDEVSATIILQEYMSR